MDTGQLRRWGSDGRKWLIVKRHGEWWVFPPNVCSEIRPGSFHAALELVRGRTADGQETA
jgi:hypothetical protein